MIIKIHPEDIIKRCLWDHYVYYILGGSDKEAEKILKENAEIEVSEKDALVIGLLKVIETDNLIHKFNGYVMELLTNKSLKEKEQKWVTRINSLPNTKVCIDLPSGLSADQFLQTESIVKGDFTLTFQVYKKSFLFPETGIYCGKIILLNIGLHPDFLKIDTFNQLIIDKEILHAFYKKRTSFSHKGTFGHSLLLVGSEGKMGACILAAKGCLRSGTGLLTLLNIKIMRRNPMQNI
jgi:NAD(P)H-hydrate epimerase